MTAFDTAFEVAFDRPLERRALAVGRIVDAIAGTPPREPVMIRVQGRGVKVRMGSDGLFAVSGRELAESVTISLAARRYAPRSIVLPISTALPVDLGIIELCPLPVRLEGRVTREADRTPLAAAEIAIEKAQKLLLLRTPLLRAHAKGAAVAILTLTTGTPRTLATAAPAGTRTFALDDASGLGPGDVLQFGKREYGVVDSASTSDVILTGALRRTYAAGAPVTPVTVGPVAAMTRTRRDAAPGDALLAIEDPTEGNAAAVGNPLEYHDLGALTDADGYFAVDGVGAERSITLVAEETAEAVTIDYGKDVNRVSLRLEKKGV